VKADAPVFDPYSGWSLPSDDYNNETYGSLKDILAALKKIDKSGVVAPDDFYSEVERVLNRYSVFIQHGVRETFGKSHKDVSWYLVDTNDGRCVVTYQDGIGHEWRDLCLSDELPLWLLIGLLNRIKGRKKLGDQATDETIERVKGVDKAYNDESERREVDENKDRTLNILKRSRIFGGGGDE
jgi:hypothetical protein